MARNSGRDSNYYYLEYCYKIGAAVVIIFASIAWLREDATKVDIEWPKQVGLLLLLAGAFGYLYMVTTQGHSRALLEDAANYKKEAESSEAEKLVAHRKYRLQEQIIELTKETLQDHKAKSDQAQFEALIDEKKKALEAALNVLIAEVEKEKPSISAVSQKAKAIMEVLGDAK